MPPPSRLLTPSLGTAMHASVVASQALRYVAAPHPGANSRLPSLQVYTNGSLLVTIPKPELFGTLVKRACIPVWPQTLESIAGWLHSTDVSDLFIGASGQWQVPWSAIPLSPGR